MDDVAAEMFDWLVTEYGFEAGGDPPDHGVFRRRYSAPKTIINVRVYLYKGCGAYIDLAPPGYERFDTLSLRLARRDLALPPSPHAFCERIRGCAHEHQVVLDALVPYAEALRRLGPWELSGDWGY